MFNLEQALKLLGLKGKSLEEVECDVISDLKLLVVDKKFSKERRKPVIIYNVEEVRIEDIDSREFKEKILGIINCKRIVVSSSRLSIQTILAKSVNVEEIFKVKSS